MPTTEALPHVLLPNALPRWNRVWICEVLPAAGLAANTGDARRLIEHGVVTLDGVTITDAALQVEWAALDGALLRVGTGRVVRLRTKGNAESASPA